MPEMVKLEPLNEEYGQHFEPWDDLKFLDHETPYAYFVQRADGRTYPYPKDAWWDSERVKLECSDCCHCIKMGETYVPYGEGMVKASDDYGCGRGYELDCCQTGDYERR